MFLNCQNTCNKQETIEKIMIFYHKPPKYWIFRWTTVVDDRQYTLHQLKLMGVDTVPYFILLKSPNLMYGFKAGELFLKIILRNNSLIS